MIFSLTVISVLAYKTILEIGNYKYEKSIIELMKDKNLNREIQSIIEHKTLDTKEYKIHYFISGNKENETIVFLHPAFSDHNAFNPQIDFFSKDYCIITIDLLGHGLSIPNNTKDKIDKSAFHINRILEKEGIEKAHMVGVSMGSLIAQYYTLEFPEKTSSLTALGGYSINEINKEVEKAQRSSNLALLLKAVISMRSFRKATAKLTCVTETGQAIFYESSLLYKRRSFMLMQGLQYIIKDREKGKQAIPTLLLTGEYDIDLAKKMANDWHSKIKNGEHKIIKNAGHCANLDNPSEFNNILLEFLSVI